MSDRDTVFACEFVQRMRVHPNVPPNLRPSSRQAISISQLLLTTRMRKGFITIEDMVDAAVVTSYPEIQEIARKVALEILLQIMPRQMMDQQQQRREGEGGGEGEGSQEQLPQQFQQGDQEQQMRGDSLEEALKKQQMQREAEEQATDSMRLLQIRSGPGENKLRRWSEWRKYYLPYTSRQRMRQRAKELIFELGSKYARRYFADEITMHREGDVLRPYSPGDDPELIDFEETIMHVLTQSKPLNYIRHDDFIIRENRGKQRAIVLLQDISGSMIGSPLWNSVLCAVMLLYGLPRDEIGIAFFEGNTYVVKELHEQRHVEDIVDDFMSVWPMNGTMASRALEWSREQLLSSKAREKFCFIFTDAGFFDMLQSLKEIQKLQQMGVKVFAIIPQVGEGRMWYPSCVRALREADCSVIEVSDPRDFPEVVSRAIKSA